MSSAKGLVLQVVTPKAGGGYLVSRGGLRVLQR